jgi:hypothetical protein
VKAGRRGRRWQAYGCRPVHIYACKGACSASASYTALAGPQQRRTTSLPHMRQGARTYAPRTITSAPAFTRTTTTTTRATVQRSLAPVRPRAASPPEQSQLARHRLDTALCGDAQLGALTPLVLVDPRPTRERVEHLPCATRPPPTPARRVRMLSKADASIPLRDVRPRTRPTSCTCARSCAGRSQGARCLAHSCSAWVWERTPCCPRSESLDPTPVLPRVRRPDDSPSLLGAV